MREAKGSITGPQVRYCQALALEAHKHNAKGLGCWDIRNVSDWSQANANAYIKAVLELKANNWESPTEDMSQHVYVIKPDGSKGTLLRRVWESQTDRLVAKGYKLGIR